MSSSRGQLACAAILLSCACKAGLEPQFAPAPRAMLPRGGSAKSAFAATISGDFYVVGAEQLGGGGGFVVPSGFTASLDGVPVPVAWLGPHALSARVPAGLAEGTHALTVHAPTGLRGTLRAAWVTSEVPPAQLTAVASAAPAQMSVGQAALVSLAVTNAGGSTAQAVAPALAQTGPGLLQVLAAPAAADIAPGATVSFSWSLRAANRGATSLSLSAAGTDALTGLPVGVAPATAGAVLVQAAASLSASATSAPSQASIGQTITVAVAVANAGEATALAVAPAAPLLGGGGGATLATSPAAQDIPGGQSRTFTWTYKAGSSGTVDFSVTASGTDANSGTIVACSVSSAPVKVQRPPALSAALSSPAVVNVGDVFTVSLAVSNNGEAAASGVAPSGFSFSPGSAVQQQSGPVPSSATVAGGSAQTFTWTFKAVAVQASPGVSFSSSATGTDANNGQPLPAAATAAASTVVQTPAALSATLSLPAFSTTGSPFQATLTVTNTGGATAINVTLPATGPTPASGNTGSATLGSAAATPPGPVTLAGGASQQFTWDYTAGNAGIFGVAVSVSGKDANNLATRSASASASTQIGQVVQIAGGTSFPGVVPTDFSYVFSYHNQVWLGPSGDGSGAVRANYDGSNPAQDLFTLEWDPGQGSGASSFSPARNPAWTATSPALTTGYLNCNQGTTACGPDNEAGRGLFFSGVLNGVEWLMLSGARPNGGTRFLYLTNGGFPLTSGGRDHFAFLNLEKVVRGSTTAATAGLPFENSVYLGSSDTGTTGGPSGYTAPVLTRIVNLPSLPGLNAVAGTDAVDMNVSVMPYIGVNGNPSNPLRGSTTSAVLVDTLVGFGAAPNDALYIANNGGWLRSIKNNPAPCVSSGGNPCADWIVTTPGGPSYTAKISVPPPASKTSDFEPQDKAVPAMAAFGGRLYAARNTTLGPQLWSCTPSQNMAGSTATSGVQCGPNDWSLVAANTVAGIDPGLTQMNSSFTAISLLVSAGGYLYVGFNNTNAYSVATNPNPGVAIYRSATLAPPASLGDFVGMGNCSPATALPTAPCQGIGGNGFGQNPPPTHIFDGKALVSGGNTYLYVSAGTGSSTAGVYRVAP
ncbi:MAG: hypothetical protein NVSMB23_09810 [Myxococcales bacterium]